MRLFVSDLDGTLLRRDGTLDAGDRRRLNALLSRGLLFTVATSRAFPSIKAILRGVGLRLPVIEQNGAVVREFDSGRVLHSVAMPSEAVQRVLEVFAQRGLDPFVSVLDGSRNPLLHRHFDNPDMAWYLDEKRSRGDLRGAEVTSYGPCASMPVLSITYLGTEEIVEQLEAIVRGRCGAVTITCTHNDYTGGAEINVSASNGDKGHALGFLRRYVGAPVEVFAFGDSGNDLPLLRAADVAVAVQHATPEILEAADLVIEGGRNNPVIRFLESRASEP